MFTTKRFSVCQIVVVNVLGRVRVHQVAPDNSEVSSVVLAIHTIVEVAVDSNHCCVHVVSDLLGVEVNHGVYQSCQQFQVSSE